MHLLLQNSYRTKAHLKISQSLGKVSITTSKTPHLIPHLQLFHNNHPNIPLSHRMLSLNLCLISQINYQHLEDSNNSHFSNKHRTNSQEDLYRAISLDKDLQDKEIKTKDLVICRQQ
jgi:hypothetical protein